MKNEYQLIINPFAEQDLIQAKEYYDSQKEELGNDFVQEVKKTIKRMQENPIQFPKEQNKQVRKAVVNRFPFVIFFYVKDLLINVFAIFHTSRNSEIWQECNRE